MQTYKSYLFLISQISNLKSQIFLKMKISNNWLKDFIKTDLATDKIGAFLTDIGLEVEGIEKFESVKGSFRRNRSR